MRALTISAHGGLDRLEVRDDVAAPEIRTPTDVRIRVRTAALNHLDLFVVAGLPGVTIKPPWILGADAYGVVESVGDEVKSVVPGDHVVVNAGLSDRTCEYCREGEQPLCPRFGLLGEHHPGTLAELLVVPEANVRTVPPTISPPHAGAFVLAALTAWRMVVTRARVRSGENVLIWGISGGVALATLQLCKQIGARVWAVSSSDDKLKRAAALGADELLNHERLDVGRVVRDRTAKRGVDVVIDNVGKASWSSSLVALGRRGRLVTCGATSGPIVETDVRRLFWNQWSILGSTMGNDAEFDAVVGELRAGRLLPVIDSEFSLEQGRAAFERQADPARFGKVVVRVS